MKLVTYLCFNINGGRNTKGNHDFFLMKGNVNISGWDLALTFYCKYLGKNEKNMKKEHEKNSPTPSRVDELNPCFFHISTRI